MTSLPLHALVQVVAHLPTPLVVTDEDGFVVGVSDSASDLLGEDFVFDADAPTHLWHHLATMTIAPRTAEPTSIVCDGSPHELIGLSERFSRPSVPPDVATLAGEVAHDFNNLLGVIINFASLAAADLTPGSAGERDLREVIVAAKRGAVITQRLLDVGQAGQVDGHQTDPRDAVNARFRKAFPTDVAPASVDGDGNNT